MNPFLNTIGSTITRTGRHAHLLVSEMGGRAIMESPAAVMEEVSFRATHVSTLLAELFAEVEKHYNFWEPTEA